MTRRYPEEKGGKLGGARCCMKECIGKGRKRTDKWLGETLKKEDEARKKEHPAELGGGKSGFNGTILQPEKEGRKNSSLPGTTSRPGKKTRFAKNASSEKHPGGKATPFKKEGVFQSKKW